MATPGKIPSKPLSCYPKRRDPDIPRMHGKCTAETVLKHYEQDAVKCVSTCKRPFSLPVIARNVGVLDSVHFKSAVPYMDHYRIDDFRSSQTMHQMAMDPTFMAMMYQKRDVHILYPGSGSHMAPLEIAMTGIDAGALDSAHLMYTEIDAKSEARVREHLQLLAGPVHLIVDLQESTKQYTPGAETTFIFSYKGKPITLVFATNRGGIHWATDEAIRLSDVVIFHDSVYNLNGSGEITNDADAFIQYLQELSNADGQKRFVLTENEWERSCDALGCKINGQFYSPKFFSGYYGCGSQRASVFDHVPGYHDVNGRLEDDPKLRRSHVHIGSPFHMPMLLSIERRS